MSLEVGGIFFTFFLGLKEGRVEGVEAGVLLIEENIKCVNTFIYLEVLSWIRITFMIYSSFLLIRFCGWVIRFRFVVY